MSVQKMMFLISINTIIKTMIWLTLVIQFTFLILLMLMDKNNSIHVITQNYFKRNNFFFKT